MKRFPLENETRSDELEVKVNYSLGGYNYFANQQNGRGYSVHLQPMKVEHRELSDGTKYTTHSMSLMGSKDESGYKIFLEGTKRKSAKRLGQLSDIIDHHAESLAKLFEQGLHDAVYQYVKTEIAI